MNCSLNRLFALLAEDREIDAAAAGDRACQGDLFGEAPVTGDCPPVSEADFAVVAGLYSSGGPDFSALPQAACRLFELSVNAFGAVVHAWMSGLPLQAETVRFGRKVLACADRAAADKAAADRGDSDTLRVLETAYKVRYEVDRLRGFLRFSSGAHGVYTARCAPDHFVLPALCEHFDRRFGDTSWAIIDEKRRLGLYRLSGKPPLFCYTDKIPNPVYTPPSGSNEWEKLWRQYHKTINNESRNNPGLQRRFMPERYRKYLTEL